MVLMAFISGIPWIAWSHSRWQHHKEFLRFIMKKSSINIDKESAPLLYEALKAMLELIGDEDLPDNGELSGAAICDLARYAVAKAEKRA